jgi:hypothetical protein
MPSRVRLGDVLAIPLSEGVYAFCRVLKDASVGVYRFLASSPKNLPSPETGYLFVVGVYRDVLTSGGWPVVARRPFVDEDAAWPPPHVVQDPLSGRFSIYHRGTFRPATPEEDAGQLEPAAVWDKEHIVARIAQAGLKVET